MTASTIAAAGAAQWAPATGRRRALAARQLLQPLACVVAVMVSLAYVNLTDVSASEKRSLGISNLLVLLGQHMAISVAATVLTCAVAIPLGIALTRGPVRRYAKTITTLVGFGQAAPAIGLIALGAVLFGIGGIGAVLALTVYGALPIVANTVIGLDGVDTRLVEAARGMGMSARSTLIRVELPLALRVIVAGVRTALVLIVGTAALASFTGAGGLGQLITTGIKLQQPVTLVVGAILVAALALFIDWLARVVEIIAAPRGL
ncbi:ABC transporter permease [Mycobacteroides abscessus]|uniref:ABC transporter permease n=1 Tax=Mycobacteroides abscessus subsp. bolletii TaxID=319705 RepID=A0A9Q7SC87_9MYCO|nr:ABC transporter permease [Mycobacteroides abscessus]MDO3129041.1 ABC transporter permease [Mycobacteroides abscessus subsp. bolletii]ORA29642.1 ABC transporter permease [Mycobacteroides abscessus subsp. bolletii]TPF67216.1 ABC transporter permease [Mycobacteroides abscessus subsp. bolletii]CPW76103.1 Putative ABC transporter%2C permease protein [Mycobacteroides abscessus]SHP88168.1 Putative ABC transporter, permease protein [Mycobacteroides abscessus subsp. bolletii]